MKTTLLLIRFANLCAGRNLPGNVIYVTAKQKFAGKLCPSRIREILKAAGLFVI